MQRNNTLAITSCTYVMNFHSNHASWCSTNGKHEQKKNRNIGPEINSPSPNIILFGKQIKSLKLTNLWDKCIILIQNVSKATSHSSCNIPPNSADQEICMSKDLWKRRQWAKENSEGCTYLPSTTTQPPVMYSQQWSPVPSTTAWPREFLTANLSPALPLTKT